MKDFLPRRITGMPGLKYLSRNSSKDKSSNLSIDLNLDSSILYEFQSMVQDEMKNSFQSLSSGKTRYLPTAKKDMQPKVEFILTS